MNDLRDEFPIGMRVLAVDDDKTYLKNLETLLLSCQYHVTTAHNAITALMLLRENKDNYDLVMTKDHMPDMDGFKLLEHVRHEMDIPVIMFSANYDQKMVMQGIVHGASDYLLTPIRIQELQIIWQHVIIKKTNKTSNHDAPKSDMGNGLDSTAQNMPQFFWTDDLHRKFVAAVNQLGIDEVEPKKIHDMMNVENLTWEDVEIHLKKYRLTLKKGGYLSDST